MYLYHLYDICFVDVDHVGAEVLQLALLNTYTADQSSRHIYKYRLIPTCRRLRVSGDYSSGKGNKWMIYAYHLPLFPHPPLRSSPPKSFLHRFAAVLTRWQQ